MTAGHCIPAQGCKEKCGAWAFRRQAGQCEREWAGAGVPAPSLLLSQRCSGRLREEEASRWCGGEVERGEVALWERGKANALGLQQCPQNRVVSISALSRE